MIGGFYTCRKAESPTLADQALDVLSCKSYFMRRRRVVFVNFTPPRSFITRSLAK
jgi:hypothetical protein